MCLGAWNYIAPIVRRDTQAALKAYAAANNVTLPAFEPTDAVIQDRCAPDV